MSASRQFAALAALALVACSSPISDDKVDAGPVDAATDAGSTIDAGVDGGEVDGGEVDGGDERARPCTTRTSRVACDSISVCVWLEAGCGPKPPQGNSCRSNTECRDDASCATGEKCVEVSVPCAQQECSACNEVKSICLPADEVPCAGASRGRLGACLGPADEAYPAVCCAPYDCDATKVTCLQPHAACVEGERASVFGSCWGPCVPGDLCAPLSEQSLCVSTGGTWNPSACGHDTCGVPGACAALIPGCQCGPTRIFQGGQGCIESETCRAQLGETCGGNAIGAKSCAAGLLCEAPAGAPEDTPGHCVIDQHYTCSASAACPNGTVCCNSCSGVACRDSCWHPDAAGNCPFDSP